MNNGAIITADIVNSTLLTGKQEKKLFNNLKSILEPNLFEFYRGDSFQVYLKEPEDALKLALQARLAGKKLTPELSVSPFDVRISIGIGTLPAQVKTLKTATGEAFILSGRAFDEMRNTETRMMIQSAKPDINSTLKVISSFIDYIFQKLTTRQATVVYELTLGNTQMEAAKRLKKSQPTINKHAQSAGWPQIATLLDAYRQLTKQL